MIDSISDLEELVLRQPELVFLGMKFVPIDPNSDMLDSPKVWVGQYLSAHGIASTGSDSHAHMLELNKFDAKQAILDAGLDTARSFVISRNDQMPADDARLGFPVFIKPLNRGGGAGIDKDSLARTTLALRSKAESIHLGLGSDALIEQYLPGREFSVAVLKNEDSIGYTVMPIELVAPADANGARMLSSAVKSSDSEGVSVVLSGRLRDEICDLALASFIALGARDYGRIDIRLDQYGVPHFLEANLIPSLIENYGSFPKSCLLNSQLSFDTVITSIASLAFSRISAKRLPLSNYTS